jgi:steroid 5-alpha reductase family enzyme
VRRVTKRASLARITVLYVVAVLAAAAWLALGPDTGHRWLDTLLADVVATLVVFAGSRLLHNSSCYDAYWSVAPPLLAAWWWSTADPGADRLRLGVATGVIVVWAVRLTANWAIGFPGLHHEDWRYARLRDRAGRAELVVDLAAIHLIPTLQVFAGMLPFYVLSARRTAAFGWLDAVATVVGLGAVLLELVADGQLRRFVARRAPGAVLDTGVWGWSRHPNYFGEFAFWVSLALFGTAAAPAQLWAWLGVVLMLAMLQGASIPLMEERSLERRPAYADVVARVPRFVPRPPRRPRAA